MATIILNHPLIDHKLTIMRNKETGTKEFRQNLDEIAMLMAYEVTKSLPLQNIEIETPICSMTGKKLVRPIVLVPILRAGLAISDVASEIIPDASIQHVGMYRDETTLEPVWYYDKTPVLYENPEKIKVFILDPMIATGNSSHAAISLFLKKGILIQNMVFVSILSCPEGLKLLSKDFPNLKIITAQIDERLNSRGYIVPGLGDAGDRLFNTFEK